MPDTPGFAEPVRKSSIHSQNTRSRLVDQNSKIRLRHESSRNSLTGNSEVMQRRQNYKEMRRRQNEARKKLSVCCDDDASRDIKSTSNFNFSSIGMSRSRKENSATLKGFSSVNFKVSDLFNKIHEEFEADDVKELKKDIKESFKQSEKPPNTHLSYYKILKLIGKGSFGKVYLGLQILTNRLVAIKCLEKSSFKDDATKEKILLEIEILKKVTSVKGVSRLIEVFENKKYVFCVMMYYKEGDLLKYLKKKEVLKEEEAKTLFKKIAIALHGIHSRNILHRDIKLDNILLHDNLEPIICDFGVSREMKEGEVVNEQCGTPAYIAPEIINDTGYVGFKADIWSLGVLLFATVTGKMPFKAPTIDDLHDTIKIGDYEFPEDSELTGKLKDLVKQMLVVDPVERINIEDVLKHEWLSFDEEEIDCLKMENLEREVHPRLEIVEQVEKYGYPQNFVIDALVKKELIHCTACYYNLERDFS